MNRANAAIDRSVLPRKLRARLWCDHRVDQFASWLVARGHWRAAAWVWQTYGAW